MELTLTHILFIGIAIFFVTMFLGMPIGISMLFSGFIGIWLICGLGPALSNTATVIWRQVNNYLMTTIPLFIFMGTLAGAAGLSGDAFATLYKWLGRLPGGLAMATTGTCTAFGAVCGHPTATSATMIYVALPEMRKYGYADSLSLGTIVSAGNLGAIIPPSVLLILYGFITETSVGPLFLAGILPGLLITIMFWLQIYLQCRLNPKLAPQGPTSSWKEKLLAIKGIWGIAAAFIIIMGGIYAGIFTPTEGGSVGTAAVCILGLINRRLTWKGFLDSLLEAGRMTAMIMLIIFGAMVFNVFIAASQVNYMLADIMEGLILNRYAILAIVMVFYLICGFFLDIWAIFIVTLPITYSLVVTNAGFDPVHFGILCTVNVLIGGITPPIGLQVFVIAGMCPGVPLSTIFKGTWPFVASMVLALIILLVVPQISLIIPDFAIPYR